MGVSADIVCTHVPWDSQRGIITIVIIPSMRHFEWPGRPSGLSNNPIVAKYLIYDRLLHARACPM